MARVSHYLGSKPYPFCLDANGVAELESLTGLGLWALEARLAGRTCTSREVQAAFRLGLVGAGLKEQEALQLTAVHVVIGRLEKAREIALLVVADAVRGISEAEAEIERPGKPEGAAAPLSELSPTGASTGPQSSEASPPTGSRQRRSRAPK
ncbi:GTA-gp10 family protein [Hyphomonas sp.]|uniref:GTA-gp10 family protein n=1 Tax=Hyphomonas sp. TaxID=87 RepID=UPI0025BFFAB1|nr:GTA-gp10 family protein [Hyphomonas sp.]MBI1401457.1 hypothetical protein [Hyphomonas sp.]